MTRARDGPETISPHSSFPSPRRGSVTLFIQTGQQLYRTARFRYSNKIVTLSVRARTAVFCPGKRHDSSPRILIVPRYFAFLDRQPPVGMRRPTLSVEIFQHLPSITLLDFSSRELMAYRIERGHDPRREEVEGSSERSLNHRRPKNIPLVRGGNRG